tara:strand:+ start:6827 stop:7927 length:1101 start_codon:yes stop_codon:yes gene_type:complete
MENKNILYNLSIQQANNSNALAYNKKYVAENIDTTFGILDNAYKGTGKTYAKLKMAIESGKCMSDNCDYEYNQLQILNAAPQKSLEFIQQVVDQLATTEDRYYDVNNDYAFMVANCIINNKPGFSKTEGYNVYLKLLENGSQELTFEGPMFENPLVINSNTLKALLGAGNDLIASTPDINADMLNLLVDSGVLAQGSQDENGELVPEAAISEEFILKNIDGSFDYEIIDIGMGKGRNILKFDLDKIERKVKPFINAEVSGLLQQEQEVVAAWNVFIARGSSEEEDDQMMQNANAGSLSWDYEKVLPLSQENKILFEDKYTKYFMKNYLKQFITQKLPIVEQDAAVFDLAEAKKAKAQKFMDDNKLS